MRLYDHGSFGYLHASICHTGMQQAALCDPYFLLCERVKDSRNRAKVVVLLLKDQVHMYYLCHASFRMFHAANIPNNYYLE